MTWFVRHISLTRACGTLCCVDSFFFICSVFCFPFFCFVFVCIASFLFIGGGGGGYFFVYLFYFWLCFFPSFLFFSFFFVPLSFSPVHCSVLSLGLSLFLILSFVFRKKTIKWRRWSRLETICWLSGQNEKRL